MRSRETITDPKASPFDAEVVRGFVSEFLLARFYERSPIAPIHIALWNAVCDPYPYVDIAAPREHSKTTTINHAYGLAAALFKAHPFQLKISATYSLACERILAAKDELRNNELIAHFFGFEGFARDRDDDFIATLRGGYQFRMAAMGMEQATRGWSWGTIRPTLIHVDDGEKDIEVLNPETRNRVTDTLLQVILPMGARNCVYRVYGTILHQDSMLARLQRNKLWKSYRFEACDEQVSEASLLWPERFPKPEMDKIKAMFIEAGKLDKFNMEYRNIAISAETSFFRPEDFRPMSEEEEKRPKLYYVGGDLAFSKREKRDYTVFYVGGLDEEGILHIVDEWRGRWDGKEVIDAMYAIEEAWGIEEWFIESGAVKETLGTALELRMAQEGILNLCPGLIPSKDKAVRAMPIQARMRSKHLRFDTEAPWFADAKQELLEFAQEGTRGAHDDRVDALAWLGQGIKRMTSPAPMDDIERDELRQMRRQAQAVDPLSFGCTGYEYYRQRTGF